MDKGPLRLRGCELLMQRRNEVQKPIPRLAAVFEVQLSSDLTGCRNPGARHSVIELQHPYPSAIEDVMHRGVVDRKGRSFPRSAILCFFEASNPEKVAIKCVGRRITL